MSEPEHVSRTPILDLEQPLQFPSPQPSKKAQWAGRVVGVLAALLAVGLHTLIPFIVILAYFLISLLVVLVHEFGHWLAGRSVGMRLVYLVVGPLKLTRQSGEWRLYRSSFTGGLILMSLDKVRRVRRRLLVWVMGGPAASLITGTIALFALRVESFGGNPWIGFPLAGFAILSLLAGIQSLRNKRFRGYAGDGVLLRTLWDSYEGAKQQIAAHALQIQESKGWEDPLWRRRWMRMASVPTEVHATSFHSDLLLFQLSTDPDLAAECLERCLAGLACLPPSQRDDNIDLLCLEAAAFVARYRADAEKARTWLSRAPHPERALPLLRRKVQAALHCASGEFDRAIAELDEGLKSLEQLHAGARGNALKTSWMEWRSEIQAKREALIPVSH